VNNLVFGETEVTSSFRVGQLEYGEGGGSTEDTGFDKSTRREGKLGRPGLRVWYGGRKQGKGLLIPVSRLGLQDGWA
jgi:hypothetical protein